MIATVMLALSLAMPSVPHCYRAEALEAYESNGRHVLELRVYRGRGKGRVISASCSEQTAADRACRALESGDRVYICLDRDGRGAPERLSTFSDSPPPWMRPE